MVEETWFLESRRLKMEKSLIFVEKNESVRNFF